MSIIPATQELRQETHLSLVFEASLGNRESPKINVLRKFAGSKKRPRYLKPSEGNMASSPFPQSAMRFKI
jgi:hypothetical protein